MESKYDPDEFFNRKKQTNADRIRAMPDEELALWLFKNNACVDFPTYKCNGKPCHDCWLDWLQQEVGTNDN